MEGAGGDRLPDTEAAEARTQLAGGLAGEGDREHVGGIDESLARLPRDAPGEHAGLARAGAGEDRQRRGAAGDRVALRCVETVEERVHRGTVPRGCDADAHSRRPTEHRAAQHARNSRRPRVVSAASQLGSPRGRSRRPSSDSSPQGCPRCSASAVGLRLSSPPGGGPVRLGHRTGSVPIRLPGLPVRSARAIRLASTSRASRPFLPGTGPVFTGLASYRRAGGNARGISGSSRVRSLAWSSVSASEFEDAWSADALDEIPAGARAELENVAVVVEDWPTRRAARRASARGEHAPRVCTRACRSPARTAQLQRRRARPHHDLPGTVGAPRATTLDELAAQVRVTVLHEVGHYFGMDDERLDEPGWA